MICLGIVMSYVHYQWLMFVCIRVVLSSVCLYRVCDSTYISYVFRGKLKLNLISKYYFFIHQNSKGRLVHKKLYKVLLWYKILFKCFIRFDKHYSFISSYWYLMIYSQPNLGLSRHGILYPEFCPNYLDGYDKWDSKLELK